MIARLLVAVLSCLVWASAADAQGAVSFRGKTVTMIIGSASGGGTDTAGRLIAQYLVRYLPDQPTLVVRNIPGAEGITALNFFVQQPAPDGLTVTMGTSTLADPLHYRRPQAHFDPTTFAIVGGVGRGGTMLIINAAATSRLTDKSLPPAVMGTLGGVPRSGMQTTAWGVQFLDWNARWVVGYRGTNDLMLALERGEIDLTSTGNLFQVEDLLKSGRFRVLSQSGTIVNGAFAPRPDIPDAPVFSTVMAGRIADPVQRQAFAYWSAMTVIDKWIALPPGTPVAVVDVYRAAFAHVVDDREFIETGRKISEDFSPMTHQDVEALMRTIGATPPEAMAFTATMLRRQGLEVE